MSDAPAEDVAAVFRYLRTHESGGPISIQREMHISYFRALSAINVLVDAGFVVPNGHLLNSYRLYQGETTHDAD